VLRFAAAMGLLWLSTVPLTSGLVAVCSAPATSGCCSASGAERGRSVRRHVLVALLLTIAATGGAVYQASAATGSGSASSSLRLVCPLH
jgi:hypothetical protein